MATAAALGICSTVAGGAPLQPIKAWVLDYGETQCIAERQYGKETDPITFAIRPAPNGQTYELLIARKAGGPAFAEELEGSVDFGQGSIKAWLLHYRGKTSKLSFHQFRITAAQMAQARAATSVTLRVKNGFEFSVALANMAALLSGLESCTADLKRHWNMWGSENGNVTDRARGDVRGLFTADDYPAEALGRLQEGSSQFLLLVDENGRVAGCYLVKASGVPALDAMGCQVIRERAKFNPARDRNGKPVRDSYVTPLIVWRLG